MRDQAQTRVVQPLRWHKFWIGRKDPIVQLSNGLVFITPRRPTSNQLVNDDAKGPHVRRKTISVPEDDLWGCRLWSTKAVRLIFDVKVGEALGRVFFKRMPSTTVGSNNSREAEVTHNGMTILRQKNILEFEVTMKDVVGVEIVDGPQNLFDIKVGDIDGKAAESFNFVPEVPRVYRLMGKQYQEMSGMWVFWRRKNTHTVTR